MFKKLVLLVGGLVLLQCAPEAPLVMPDEFDSPLVVKKSVYPEYPPEAREKGYEGTVILEAVVDVDGTVESVEVTQSSGYSELDEAAKDAAKEWLFSEPTRNGQPVRTLAVLKFVFNRGQLA